MGDLERPAQTHRARETTEASFQQMEAGFGGDAGRGFFTGHEEDVAPEEHPHGFGGNAGHVHDDFNGRGRLDHVERRMVLAGVGPLLGRERFSQVGEDLAEVVHQFA